MKGLCFDEVMKFIGYHFNLCVCSKRMWSGCAVSKSDWRALFSSSVTEAKNVWIIW